MERSISTQKLLSQISSNYFAKITNSRDSTLFAKLVTFGILRNIYFLHIERAYYDIYKFK